MCNSSTWEFALSLSEAAASALVESQQGLSDPPGPSPCLLTYSLSQPRGPTPGSCYPPPRASDVGSFWLRGEGQHRTGKAVVEGEALLTLVNASKLIASLSWDRGKEAGEGDMPSLADLQNTRIHSRAHLSLFSHRLRRSQQLREVTDGGGEGDPSQLQGTQRLVAHSGTIGFCPWETSWVLVIQGQRKVSKKVLSIHWVKKTVVFIGHRVRVGNHWLMNFGTGAPAGR